MAYASTFPFHRSAAAGGRGEMDATEETSPGYEALQRKLNKSGKGIGRKIKMGLETV